MLHLLLFSTAALALVALRRTPFGQTAEWLDLEPLDLGGDDSPGLPPSVAVEPTGEPSQWRVTFSFASEEDAHSCALVGNFNHWNAESHPMERTSDGRWRGVVELMSGVWEYKFCVDGSRWIPDPENEESEDDGFASENSIVRLGALGRPETLHAERGDGEVQAQALGHDPTRPKYVHRLPGRAVRIRYRTLDDDVESVALHVRDREPLQMAPIVSPAPFQYWQVDIPLTDESITYAFAVHDGDRTAKDPRAFTISGAELPEIRTPDWAKGAVWYQIFPERFRNGDSSNDPSPVREWTSDWNVPADFEGQDGQTFWEFYVYHRMYGGDLAGIEEKLDYIVGLGVTALYLNPVFHAEGPHKYNATDFRHIDTSFGAGENFYEATVGEDLLDPNTWTWTPSDRVFLDFVKACKARGLRVVLDAVFNHVGVQHPAFQDVQIKREKSAYSDWFKIRSFEPFEYAGWAGFGELPAFAKSPEGFASDAVKDHVFAVTRRWMAPNGDVSAGIDGWRLDVPMELPRAFWREWRALVKSINPDAYISGEIWDRADRWLDGKTFDAVMNYRFAEPVIAWVGNVEKKIGPTELDRRLLELRIAYPSEVTFALMNLVDSHDTDRVASMLLNPDRPYDRSNQIQRHDDYNAGRPSDEEFAKVRLIALLQMTYPGAPMIFYGDEAGMWGADDPTNRQPMVWKDLEPYAKNEEVYVFDEHLDAYREMAALRSRFTALRLGGMRTRVTDDDQDLWVFERATENETVLVALNASKAEARFDLPGGGGIWTAVYGPTPDREVEEGGVVRVSPISGRVWVRDAHV